MLNPVLAPLHDSIAKLSIEDGERNYLRIRLLESVIWIAQVKSLKSGVIEP